MKGYKMHLKIEKQNKNNVRCKLNKDFHLKFQDGFQI